VLAITGILDVYQFPSSLTSPYNFRIKSPEPFVALFGTIPLAKAPENPHRRAAGMDDGKYRLIVFAVVSTAVAVTVSSLSPLSITNFSLLNMPVAELTPTVFAAPRSAVATAAHKVTFITALHGAPEAGGRSAILPAWPIPVEVTPLRCEHCYAFPCDSQLSPAFFIIASWRTSRFRSPPGE